jgi:hypothetical protein
MEGAVVLGVVGEGEAGHLGYLAELVPASPEVLALSGGADPSEVFRLAAPCAGDGCGHFEGERCRLAARVARLLPAVAGGLPPCRLRRVCRWWRQEGVAACLRCPQVVSGVAEPSELLIRVSDLLSPVPT